MDGLTCLRAVCGNSRGCGLPGACSHTCIATQTQAHSPPCACRQRRRAVHLRRSCIHRELHLHPQRGAVRRRNRPRLLRRPLLGWAQRGTACGGLLSSWGCCQRCLEGDETLLLPCQGRGVGVSGCRLPRWQLPSQQAARLPSARPSPCFPSVQPTLRMTATTRTCLATMCMWMTPVSAVVIPSAVCFPSACAFLVPPPPPPPALAAAAGRAVRLRCMPAGAQARCDPTAPWLQRGRRPVGSACGAVDGRSRPLQPCSLSPTCCGTAPASPQVPPGC
jgi:hypothetical protein